MATAESPIPRATYRLQLNSRFTFTDAGALAPYLAQLGVSHVYASPFLKARPGSTHGYDIVDHDALNPELGTSEDFARMSEAFRSHGLGLILDFVPNHMGVGGADNPFWLDMLEWGPASDYAGWFDIDWQPEGPHLAGKVLIPVLGGQYGAVLADGGLELRFDEAAGELAVWAHGVHKLPVYPGHYVRILGGAHAELEKLGDAFSHLAGFRPHEQRRVRELKAQLAALVAEDAQAATAVAQGVARFAGKAGDVESWLRLDRLIADQHWRVAFFRVAADDINYRRFFNISDLAGLRIEHEELFDHAHRLVFELIGQGTLDGLRIDHIDGLLDPRTYCLRLREKAPQPIYLVVEKILGPGEELREDWQVDGTTGYEFANLLTHLLIDQAGEPRLSELYRRFSGESRTFDAIMRECKLAIMEDEMASELGGLAREAARIARSNPRTADFTRNVLQRALREIVAGFRVYRTYVDPAGASKTDLVELGHAVARARRTGSGIDRSVFDFLFSVLSCEAVAKPGSGFSRQDVLRFAMKFQQYTGPVMAKGVEDTAFYRYNRFVAANEVGGHPGRLGSSVAAFHAANRARHAGAMLGTSTHDTKRGEDCRARLAVLSEIAPDFAEAVLRWQGMLGSSAAMPDSNDIFLFCQLLVGAWPLESGSLEGFEERIQAAMLKSVREAKVHTNWAAPDEDYEVGLRAFIAGAFANQAFLADFTAFQERILPLGAANSLVQTVLKFTVPGVPDLYQGAEGFDLSLVDPDNRRPVDWVWRSSRLGGAGQPIAACDLADGSAKLAATAKLLALRREHAALFAEGEYQPIELEDERLIAFSRQHGEGSIIVAAARFPSRGAAGGLLPLPSRRPLYCDILSGRQITAGTEGIDVAMLLADLPAAVLMPVHPTAVRRSRR
ncbi:malto-oligosyltrehalose synthase [Labrys miyagiensis]|uniref:Malto-oligosyltrehalose synthase n=1 Tax=Labrys miyagiensis TaxID=346912 RepID=A0ABQ6CNG3_9HYPH|nr:malto-oligosyltrehalose synthase [Labrys miyagiensis]GLS19776.1 malto-oligosyltrehalose synthase [Labrys miyagiensis]